LQACAHQHQTPLTQGKSTDGSKGSRVTKHMNTRGTEGSPQLLTRSMPKPQESTMSSKPGKQRDDTNGAYLALDSCAGAEGDGEVLERVLLGRTASLLGSLLMRRLRGPQRLQRHWADHPCCRVCQRSAPTAVLAATWPRPSAPCWKPRACPASASAWTGQGGGPHHPGSARCSQARPLQGRRRWSHSCAGRAPGPSPRSLRAGWPAAPPPAASARALCRLPRGHRGKAARAHVARVLVLMLVLLLVRVLASKLPEAWHGASG